MDRRDRTVERRELHSIPVINLNGKEWVCVYIYLNHFAVEQKLTQHVNKPHFNKVNFRKIKAYVYRVFVLPDTGNVSRKNFLSEKWH